MADLDITTTAGEVFTYAESCQMARLVLKRFGGDVAAAAAAWRRMLGNSCPDADFQAMATRSVVVLRPAQFTTAGDFRVHDTITALAAATAALRFVAMIPYTDTTRGPDVCLAEMMRIAVETVRAIEAVNNPEG